MNEHLLASVITQLTITFYHRNVRLLLIRMSRSQ